MIGFLYCLLEMNPLKLNCITSYLTIIFFHCGFTMQNTLWVIVWEDFTSCMQESYYDHIRLGICTFLTWSASPLQQRCFMPFTQLLSQLHTVAWQQSHNHFIQNHHFSFWKSVTVTDWKIGSGDVIGTEYEQCVWLYCIIPVCTAKT